MVKVADHVSSIILAAGYSSRMGDAFKPLLKIGGDSLVGYVVKTHLKAGIRDIKVVVGHRADEVAGAVDHLGVEVVQNRFYDKGMFSSVHAGVASLKPDSEAFFIMPVDIPWVAPSTIQIILDCYSKNSHGITYPTYQGQRGHPPLIAARYRPEIMTSPAPDGLRGILNKHDGEAGEVAVDDEAILLDIDTLEDYYRLRNYRQIDTIPDEERCLQLLEEVHIEEPVFSHCSLVASVACHWTDFLNSAGASLNKDLIRAAALLHDIMRDKADHARAGAAFLRARGYRQVADIVATHMDIDNVEGVLPTEAEIVYLADKVVLGQDIVTLEKRFAAAAERHHNNEQASLSIGRRRQQAEMIKKKLESVIGDSLEEITPVHFVGLTGRS